MWLGRCGSIFGGEERRRREAVWGGGECFNEK